MAIPAPENRRFGMVRGSLLGRLGDHSEGLLIINTATQQVIERRINWRSTARRLWGTVAAVAKDEGLYLRSMAIILEARGKRIGRLLLKQVERFAVTHGHKEMTLNTTPFLSRAIALYEHFGFTRSDNGPLDLFGTPLFSMIKSL